MAFVPQCWVFILFCYPFVTQIAAQYLIRWNPPLNPGTASIFKETTFLFGRIFTPELAGKYPTPQFSYAVFVAALGGILLTLKIRIPKPVAVWVCFVSLIGMASSLFFIFLPSLFPYTIQQFAEIFVKTEIAVWLCIPIIMSFSLLPIPSTMLSKFAAIIFTLFYAMAFGLVRYVLFVTILVRFSYIFMAVLFFCFGPFIDFISVVGVYSFYVSTVSKKINQDLRVWNWSY